MKITYDPSSGFVYLYRDKPQPVARTVELAPGILADYGAGGQLVGIEVWGSAGGFDLEVFRK